MPADPTPQEQERARAIVPEHSHPLDVDPDTVRGQIAAALAEQRERYCKEEGARGAATRKDAGAETRESSWRKAPAPPSDLAQDNERAQSLWDLIATTNNADRAASLIAAALAEQRERDAQIVDTPCGMDDEPNHYTCSKRGDFPVRHDPACGREDADTIRKGDA